MLACQHQLPCFVTGGRVFHALAIETREDKTQGGKAISAGPGKTRGILEKGRGQEGEEKSNGTNTQPAGWVEMKAPFQMLIFF